MEEPVLISIADAQLLKHIIGTQLLLALEQHNFL